MWCAVENTALAADEIGMLAGHDLAVVLSAVCQVDNNGMRPVITIYDHVHAVRHVGFRCTPLKLGCGYFVVAVGGVVRANGKGGVSFDDFSPVIDD